MLIDLFEIPLPVTQTPSGNLQIPLYGQCGKDSSVVRDPTTALPGNEVGHELGDVFLLK